MSCLSLAKHADIITHNMATTWIHVYCRDACVQFIPLETTGSSILFNDWWYHFMQMITVSCADCWCLRFPKLTDTSLELHLACICFSEIFFENLTFSIGLRSGLSAGVGHQLMLFLVKYSRVKWAQCFGSVSYWKLNLDGGVFDWMLVSVLLIFKIC